VIYLSLSILALLAGPFLFTLAARRPAAREALEGFILITLAGIVCLHIAPEAWQAAGFASVATGALGLAFPLLLENVFRKALSRAHLVVLALAAAGIVVHAVLDGIALLPFASGAENVAGEAHGGRALAIGVIIHRFPVGMAIWWVLRPQFGTAVAVSTFALVIVTTIVGYLLGGELFASADWSLALFQAFIAGSLIHVALFGVTHEHDHDHEHKHGGEKTSTVRSRSFQSRAYRAGLLIGLITIFILPHISG
jgi:hypothetical protein